MNILRSLLPLSDRVDNPASLPQKSPRKSCTKNSQTIVSPFIGGGGMLRSDRGLIISPAVSGGIDVPISTNFTGTLRLNAGFPSNSQAGVGILAGVGYNFGS